LAKLRWRISQDYREPKDAFGLDHFEGCTYRGWNHTSRSYRARTRSSPWSDDDARQPGDGLALFAVVRELHALLACWQGNCPTCHRERRVDRAVGDVDLGARGGMIVGDAW
jgi:hypothetical protein